MDTEELIKAIKENTDATRENTDAIHTFLFDEAYEEETESYQEM